MTQLHCRPVRGPDVDGVDEHDDGYHVHDKKKGSSKHLAEVGKQILMSPRAHISPKAFNALSSSGGSPVTPRRKPGQMKKSSSVSNENDDEDSDDSYEDDDFDDDDEDIGNEEAPRLTCLPDPKSESLLESVSPKACMLLVFPSLFYRCACTIADSGRGHFAAP